MHALNQYMVEGPCEAHDTGFVMEAQQQMATEWQRVAVPTTVVSDKSALLRDAIERHRVAVALVDVPSFHKDAMVYAGCVRDNSRSVVASAGLALGMDPAYCDLSAAAAASLELLLFFDKPLPQLPPGGLPFEVRGTQMCITRIFNAKDLDVEFELNEDEVQSGCIAQSAAELNGEQRDAPELRIRPAPRVHPVSHNAVPALLTSPQRRLQASPPPPTGVVARGASMWDWQVQPPPPTFAAVPTTHLHALRDTLEDALRQASTQCLGYVDCVEGRRRCRNRRFADAWCQAHAEQRREHDMSIAQCFLGDGPVVSYRPPAGVTWWAPSSVEVTVTSVLHAPRSK